MDTHTWWYIARASGLVAWALTSAAVIWGLALSGRPQGRRIAPAWLNDLHEHLGALAVSFTAVHVIGLVGDSTVTFGALEVLVPWASAWRPTAVAMGVIAAWLLIAVQLTSVMRRRLPRRVWRATHRLSAPLWLLATAHLVTAGSDAGSAWVVATTTATAALVAFMTTFRLITPRRGARPARTALPTRGR